ncbi:class II glutamine amidotransferase [Corallococcus exiguus]|uniref:class II glutamine amidotransferase n=1 Tax=Corallococcus exiguus TaxID=83462 RepID=UPI003DA1DDF0
MGAVELRNSHPFHFGRWSFVHNGTLREFAKHKATVEGLIHPELRVNIKGTTDSERCFYLFLSRLSARGPLDGTVSVEAMAQALAETMTLVSTLTDVPGSREPKERSAMNFLVTDGEAMVATRRNRTLFISSGISGCPEALRTPNTGVPLQQFLVSSESLCGGPHWVPVDEEDVVGVDSRLTFHRWKVQTLADGVLNPRPPEQPALV